MDQRLAELREQARAAADAEGTDLFHRKIREMIHEVDSTIETLSPEARPFMRLSLRVCIPLLEECSAYFKKTARLAETNPWDFAKFQSSAEMESTLRQIGEVIEATKGISRVLEQTESGMKSLVGEFESEPRMQRRLLREAETVSRQRLDPLRALFEADRICFDQVQRVLTHLRNHWGKWTVAPTGQLRWTDPEAAESVRELARTLHVVVAARNAAMRTAAAAFQDLDQKR